MLSLSLLMDNAYFVFVMKKQNNNNTLIDQIVWFPSVQTFYNTAHFRFFFEDICDLLLFYSILIIVFCIFIAPNYFLIVCVRTVVRLKITFQLLVAYLCTLSRLCTSRSVQRFRAIFNQFNFVYVYCAIFFLAFF